MSHMRPTRSTIQKLKAGENQFDRKLFIIICLIHKKNIANNNERELVFDLDLTDKH